jgi:hypothetical protein
MPGDPGILDAMAKPDIADLQSRAESIRAELRVPKQNEVFKAAVEAGYLAARADGVVDAEEAAAIVRAVELLSTGAVIEWEAEELVAECARKADAETPGARAAAVGAELAALEQGEAGIYFAKLDGVPVSLDGPKPFPCGTRGLHAPPLNRRLFTGVTAAEARPSQKGTGSPGASRWAPTLPRPRASTSWSCSTASTPTTPLSTRARWTSWRSSGPTVSHRWTLPLLRSLRYRRHSTLLHRLDDGDPPIDVHAHPRS